MRSTLFASIAIIIFISTTFGCAGFPDALINLVDIRAGFSHDGKRLAIISQREGSERISLYLADHDGTNARLLSRDVDWSTTPVFTLDNKTILFLSRDQKDILNINLDTGITKKIYSLSKRTHYTNFSADGSTIMLDRVPTEVGPALIIVETNNQRIIEINDSEYPYEFISPNISADGSKLAFFHDKNLYVMTIKDSNIECLTKKYSNLLYKDWPNIDFMMTPPVFSANCNYIVFATKSTIYTIDITGNNLRKLIQYDNANKLRIYSLLFSPNNKFVLFAAEGFKRNEWISGLYLFDLEKETIKRLNDFSMFYTFSPDSKNIVYLSGFERFNCGLYAMDIDGENKRQISPNCEWCY